MTRRLLLADSKGDFKGFDEVAGMIGELKATWEAICEQGKRDVDPDTRLADPSSRQHVSMACGS
jgi:flagellin-specific chaperone FliS